MSYTALEAGTYTAPLGFEDFGERVSGDKKIILYLAETAFVDVVQLKVVEGREVLGPHIRRIDGPMDRAVDLLHHTSLFIPKADADQLFGGLEPVQ